MILTILMGHFSLNLLSGGVGTQHAMYLINFYYLIVNFIVIYNKLDCLGKVNSFTW